MRTTPRERGWLIHANDNRPCSYPRVSGDTLQPVRLSRDEVERVDVLMRLIDERTAEQG